MKRIALIMLTTMLAGCSASSLLAPSGAPAKLYTLDAPKDVTTNAPQANWQLLIAMPDAPMDLDTSRIAIAPAPTRIDYYADVAWADRPSAMLQALLLQSFDRSGRIAAVQRQSGALKSDFILTADIEDFEVDAASGDPAAPYSCRRAARAQPRPGDRRRPQFRGDGSGRQQFRWRNLGIRRRAAIDAAADRRLDPDPGRAQPVSRRHTLTSAHGDLPGAGGDWHGRPCPDHHRHRPHRRVCLPAGR